jgi:hypothetical protein
MTRSAVLRGARRLGKKDRGLLPDGITVVNAGEAKIAFLFQAVAVLVQ